MTLNERYRIHNKKRTNKSLLLYLAIFALFVFSTSFSKYLNNGASRFEAEVAKWSIKINGVQIDQSTSTITNEMNLVVTENESQDGKIMPGQKGYFDIVIDPKYTEVSLKYTITLNTTDLPENLELKSYALNDFNLKNTMPNNNTLEGLILLDGKDSLEDVDRKTFRIYWEWPQEEEPMENILENYKIKANVQVEQLIDED